ncbi:hypothetical protein HELRODRAFT_110109 [Helobdella robusta]|uniref:Peptidase S1 domain-containing protein n=1 Tax=Helobdella robusta TaxID=6412 RepID=T1EEZ1_HELRO|nr:hypothetical protein HELRODRAFT_110109 [Helobdella robusta]ESO08539.1 hypothetical protein HELRODRAFT_110109 [Helobdella robusta]
MKLTFQVMDIESSPLCGYDSVSVWDVVNEKGVPLGKFCGKTLPVETLKSTGRFLFVYFITDKSKGDGKFAIQYESVNPKPPEPSDDMCGKPAIQPSTRIVNGYQAVPHSWPWQVSIRLVIGSKQYHICGGSVISSSVIATAAHCFFDEKHKPHDFRSLKVVVGDHDQKTNLDGKTQSPAIQKVIYHQSYNPNSASSPYDIAVMLLQTPLTFDSSVSPICLPREDVSVNSLCFATGWGDTNETGDETVLNQVRLPIVSYTFCSQREYYGSQIIATMLCAGYDEGGKDACQGDSGGPLACYNNINKRWYLQGITSWGAGCAKPKRPGIYTRVTKYLGWIYQNSGVIS